MNITEQQEKYIPPSDFENQEEIVQGILIIIGIIIICILVYLAIALVNESLAIGIAVIIATVLVGLFIQSIPQLKTIPLKIQRLYSSKARKQYRHKETLHKVYKLWIENNLFKNNEPDIFDIDKALAPNMVLSSEEYGTYQVFQKNILQIFHDMGKQLLILGDAGAGKTTLLLQLAYILLGQSQIDDKQPIPLIFSLSTWTPYHRTLKAWLLNEIKNNYNLPRKFASKDLENNRFILLLDGLDEMPLEYSNECITQITNFCHNHKNTQVVISSRIFDYAILKNKLGVRGAILLEGLNEEQVKEYINTENTKGIYELIQQDIIANKMAKIPFLLNTMKISYSNIPYIGSPHNQLKLTELSEGVRIKHLFDKYVEKCLTVPSSYTHSNLLYHLKYLSHQMRAYWGTIFYIECLHPKDLPKRHQKYYNISVKIIVFGLMILPFLNIFGGLNALIIANAIFHVFISGGFIIASEFIEMNQRRRQVEYIIDTLKFIQNGDDFKTNDNSISEFIKELEAYYSNNLKMIYRYRLFRWFLAYYNHTERLYKPNLTIWRSFIKGFIVFIIGGLFSLASILPIGLLFLLTLSSENAINLLPFEARIMLLLYAVFEINFIMGVFLTGGILLGLYGGWLDVIKHCILRLWLYRSGNAPLNYKRFLKHCVDLGLMRQVGGGFMFRHLYLQDYFAGQYDSTKESN